MAGDNIKIDLLSVLDLGENLEKIIELAITLKTQGDTNDYKNILANKSMAMIFEKSSTRTRVSFEVAMTQLGGHSLFLSPKDLHLGRGETVADTARVLSRYVDIIMYRAFDHSTMRELANHASVPVINALDDLEHPCQILADLMTIKEHKGTLKGVKFSYIGDGNNVCNSLLLGSALVGMDISIGCPENFMPNQDILAKAKQIAEKNGCSIIITSDPKTAVKDSDVVYTDVWVSMGDENEHIEREKVFQPYQLNLELLKEANDNCIVMHCLPAHRGLEITDEVIDSEQSVVFDQAENRLHSQKAIILYLLGLMS
jgi:ornithine carbamoyltransferase